MIYYLRTTSESALLDALRSSGIRSEDFAGNPSYAGNAWVDFIGPIQGATGFHANLICNDPLDQSVLDKLPVIEPPITPVRAVWEI